MDREVSSAVQLGVTLMVLSALISLIMYTVYIGNTLKADVVDNTISIQTSVETGQLNSLSNGESVIMPTASIYYILTKEYSGVSEVLYPYVSATNYKRYKVNSKGYWTLNGAGTSGKYLFPADILEDAGLAGKVKVTVDRLGGGMYSVHISNISL